MKMKWTLEYQPFELFVGIVTHMARQALLNSKEFFDAEKNVEIIYGDTDSVMIYFKNTPFEHKTYRELTEDDMRFLEHNALEYTEKLNNYFSKQFARGIEMKLEKICDRGIWGDKKKQYWCRVIYDENSGWQKDEDGNLKWYEYTKGLPLVRSDRSAFLHMFQQKILNQIIDHPEGVYDLCKGIIKKYYNNEYDHMLILRTSIKKPLEDYVNETPPVVAAKKLVKRGEPFRVGEKVSYIVIDVNKSGKVVEPVDDDVDPKEAIKDLPKLSKNALDYYWKDRIWKNIKPFLEMALSPQEIKKIESVRTGERNLSEFFTI